MRRVAPLLVIASLAIATPAMAQRCSLDGVRVSCDDGRAGILNGDAIIWPDGTRSLRTPHPSVFIHDKNRTTVGQNVFVGSPSGVGVTPLDDPNAPNKRVCAVINDIPYCH